MGYVDFDKCPEKYYSVIEVFWNGVQNILMLFVTEFTLVKF